METYEKICVEKGKAVEPNLFKRSLAPETKASMRTSFGILLNSLCMASAGPFSGPGLWELAAAMAMMVLGLAFCAAT